MIHSFTSQRLRARRTSSHIEGKALSHRARVLASLAVAVFALSSVPARADDAKSIMDDVSSRFRAAKSEREESEILVISSPQEQPYTREQVQAMIADTPRNVKHKRAVRRALYDVDGIDKTNVLFSLPPEDAGLDLLVLSGVKEPNDRMWLFMPGYRSVRQIPASNTQRFADTDLLYEDVRSQAGDRTSSFDYELGSDENRNGRTCKVITATPHEDASTSYGKRILWIDAEWHFPLRIEFYDRSGKLWKVLENTETVEVGPGIRRATLSEMRDVQHNDATVFLVLDRKIGVDIPPQVFTQDFLQHPDAP